MDLILLLLIVFLPIYASSSIKLTYKKYSKVISNTKLSGKEVARKILDSNGLDDISIKQTSGELTDYYDPTNKCVVLSSDIYRGNSISSISVAAHECGHAIQDKEDYTMFVLRSKLVPVVNLTSKLSTIFVILGLIMQIANLYYVGIILLCGGLLFQLVTLPVEFNASNRAIKELEKYNLVNSSEIKGSKKVLKAAAFTYVAGFLAMLFQIIRLLYNNRD